MVEVSGLARGAKPRPPAIGKRQSRSHRPPQWNRQGLWFVHQLAITKKVSFLRTRLLGRSKWQLPTGIFLYSLRSYKVVFYQTKNLVHLNEVYLVEASGLEPPTPTLSGWCSNLLSYASILKCTWRCLVEMSGIEPLTPCLQGRCSPSWAIPPKNQA